MPPTCSTRFDMKEKYRVPKHPYSDLYQSNVVSGEKHKCTTVIPGLLKYHHQKDNPIFQWIFQLW